jgi:hypothetical protein
MPKGRFEIYTFKREMIRRDYVVEVEEKELRHILSGLKSEENVMDLDERDFLEYPNGVGQICTRVELMGAQDEMRRLQQIVGKKVYEKGLCGEAIYAYAVPAKAGLSGSVLVARVRTVL